MKQEKQVKRKKQDWTPSRKHEWDGMKAPADSIFIVIKVRKRYEAAKMIKMGQGEKVEREVQERLRDEVKKQYGV